MSQVFESHALLTQSIADGHPDFIKKQFGSVLPFQANLFQQTPLGEAGSVFLNADQGEFLGRRINLGGGDHQPGIAAVGDKGLLAVDDVVITVTPRRSAHGTQVAADTRLAHGDDADQLTTDHTWQPLLLLLFAAIGNDVRRDDFRVGGETHGGSVGPRQLFDHNRRVTEVASGATVFFGHRGA